MGDLTGDTLVLSDGRKIRYSAWGRPGAPTVVYCHGSPGNRLELRLARPVVERLGIDVRVVAFDRPGFGGSTWRRGHQFLDWPGDLTAAADLLGLDRFALLGASGGSPFALAAAYSLPDRVTRLGIVVGSGPLEANGMRDSAAMTLPSRNPFIRRLQYDMIGFAFRHGRGEKIIDQSLESMGPADRAAMQRPEVREWFGALFAEAVRQGGRASAHEAGLLWKSWGFDLSGITVPTDLWYGGRDEHVPARVGRWLADRIPGARYEVWPEHGHFTWAMSDDIGRVISTITSPV